VTRGLEPIAARELGSVPGVALGEVGYRRVAASLRGALAPLLSLRLADDVFLAAATWSGIGKPRAALAELSAQAARLDLRAAAAGCAEVRRLPATPAFAISTSFVGARNYSGEEIKRAVAETIARRHGWAWRERDDEADLGVRLFIEHETCHVGLRLARRPLHERAWKGVHRPGSLRPTVAAAMLALAGPRPGDVLLDPCCGGGTILAEAPSGITALGGDIDATALIDARANLTAVGATARLARWDARRLPLPAASVARIVCNPPWDRQVPSDDLARLYAGLGAECARVLAPGGRVILLTAVPELVRMPGLPGAVTTEISLSGQRPSVVAIG
jgi:23S rRNA G2445 N2-methylase RlmL